MRDITSLRFFFVNTSAIRQFFSFADESPGSVVVPVYLAKGPTGKPQNEDMPNLQDRILATLHAHPEGITINQMRRELGLGQDEQQHLDRRVRQLRDRYSIPFIHGRGYVIQGPRSAPIEDEGVSNRVRAAILHAARGMCQMCGRTVSDDRVRLQVDHKIPQDWGGKSDRQNLWALCSDCNQGKKAHFESFDPSVMSTLMQHKSVHVRLGEALKLGASTGVDAGFLEMVANQREWDRRLRELRDLGFEYSSAVRAEPDGRRVTTYILTKSAPWPSDVSNIRAIIGEAELERRRRRARRPDSS